MNRRGWLWGKYCLGGVNQTVPVGSCWALKQNMPSHNDIDWQDPTYEAAAEWVVRLHAAVSDSQAERDWQAFEAWLRAAQGNRAAFDAAEALWTEIGSQSPTLRRMGVAPSAISLSFRARRPSAGPAWWAAAAAAAASLLLFVGPFSLFRVPPPTVYATAKGERRVLNLADGTRIDLNSGSKVSVLIDGRRREVDLVEGSEAAFTVVHDPARPFVVQVGDRTIRDVGTQFDVLRANDMLHVTVREGQVEVAPTAGAAGQTVALSAGRQLNHRQGSPTSQVAEVTADDAFSWREGRLIYRNRSLTQVASDLSRYYSAPIKTEGAASALRFSGVLTMAGESAVVNRLTGLLPVSANAEDGVITLRERTPQR